MRRSNLWRTSLAILAGVAWSTSGSFAQQPGRAPFRTGVDIVPLHVMATDGKGRTVSGLNKDAFVVFEDRTQQEVEFFAAENVPLDLAVLLDTSGSMTAYMPDVREAALGFIHSLRPGDRASIVEFNDVVRVRADFTGAISTLENAIRTTRANGNTALFTAVYVALKSFGQSTPETLDVRRRALWSDGFDTSSLVKFDDVLELAQRMGVSVYTISLASGAAGAPTRTANPQSSQADYQMRTLARETGARAFFNRQVSELADVYADIIDELTHQYTIG